MEDLENSILTNTNYTQFYGRYVYDLFIIIPKSKPKDNDKLQFTIETQNNNTLNFLDKF